MGPEEGASVGSASTSTGLFSGPDIAAQVQELEKRVARQACKDLTLAAASGKTSEVVRSIDLGAEVDETLNSYTPLMRAATWGHVGTLVALIEEGADLFATDRRNRTALDWSRIARRDRAARVLERAMENEIRYRRETNKAVRGKRELWAVVQANAHHARDVADAVDVRDMQEVNRIVDRAKLTRHEFLSVCDRLGFRNRNETDELKDGTCHGDECEEAARATLLGGRPTAAVEPTPAVAAANGAEPGAQDQVATVVDPASLLRKVPAFFLDAEGRGGTTALALATIENDAETVRRLMKEGADPGVEASTGHTALTWAAVCGFDLVAAELLLGDSSNKSGASTSGSVEDAIKAVTRTAAVEGKTALHNAAFNGNSGVVVLLLDRLRELLLRDSFGRRGRPDDATGPGLGWFHPFRDFVRKKDRQGFTARDLARQAGYDEVGVLLDNAEGRIEGWEAGDRAQEYAAERVECGNDGCRHRDRRDRMEGHERTECPRRTAGCVACGKKLAAGDIQLHEERECEKRSDACPNAFLGCYDVMPHHKIAAHVAHICKFRRVDCRRGCGASVVAHEREVHEQEHCRLSRHPCVFGCGEKIVKAEMDAHIKKDCSKRKIRCRVGCGAGIGAGELKHHEEEVCTQPCCWEGCGERLGPLVRREVHERSLCPERPAECALGCGVRGLTAALKDVHASHHCQLRPVPCPHGCGAYIPNNKLPAHVRAEGGTCAERLQRCRFDCLGRRILVPTDDSTARVTVKDGDDGDKGEAEKEGREDQAGEVQLIPGVLRFYDTSTGLFSIRYSHRNRQQALEDLDFVWAHQGGDDGGGSNPWACGWIPAAEMAEHLLHSCPRRSALCRDGCGQSLVVMEAERHYQHHCPKRFVVCPLGCGAEVRQERLGEHTDGECPLRRSPCEACGLPLPLESHAKHLAESCARVPRRCTNGCGAHVRGEDLPHHLSTECPKRVVPCPLGCPEENLWAEEVASHVGDSCPLQLEPCRKGCGMQVAVCSREKHEAEECSERLVTCECGVEHPFSKTEDHRIMECDAVVVYCSLGCGVKVRKMDMDLHQEGACERTTLRTLSKMIECPLGCGHLILRQWEFQHRTLDCPKRPARCPGGCSADVTAEKAATHYMTCGRRRIRCGADSTGCERMLLTWVGLTEGSLKRRRDEVSLVGPLEGAGHSEGGEGLVGCSDHGSDALMWAAGRGDSEHALLEELLTLSGGASINRECHQGDTALTIACSRGHVETVRILVKAGHADVNHETPAGKTALIEAARHGRTAVVRLLMEFRAVIPYKNRRGQTAAWWAKRLGHQECVLPMMREVKAEATLRLMSSQIARGDVNAVRSLVQLGEPYKDNHCDHLETEIDQVTRELEAAAKELRELSTLKEQLLPELERLKASLAVDLARRRKTEREAARAARAARAGGETNYGNQAASARRPGPKPAAISSRSFEAMQSRALRLFQRSVSRFQALTEDDFKRVAGLNLLSDNADEGAADRRGRVGDVGGGGDVEDHNGVGQEQARNPTPSLSAAASSSSSSSRRPSRGSSKDEDGGSSDGVEHRPEEMGEFLGGGKEGEKETESQPSSAVAAPAAAAILRLLRATVLVLGGLGLGALPSDEDLWDAVRPMLSDGSLRHRLRHFDRRSVPAGLLDGARALLNIDIDTDNYDEDEGDTDRLAYPARTDTPGADVPRDQSYAGNDGEGTVGSVDTVDGNRPTRNDGALVSAHTRLRDSDNDDGGGDRTTTRMILGGTSKTQSHASTTDDGGGRTDDDDSDQEDGDDPWGDGRGESIWGQRIGAMPGTSGIDGDAAGLALVRALGSWCASVSAYDRLAYLVPGSAARRAAEAETEWDELERRIARSSLDVQLEEFSLQVLSEEITSATESTEYLSQKRAWGEDRLGVARLLSLFSPAGHSLVSWAAACGQTELVEILMNHGATAELGDETRAVSASIIQAFYRFQRYRRQALRDAAEASRPAAAESSVNHSSESSTSDIDSSDGGDGRGEPSTTTTTTITITAAASRNRGRRNVLQAEGRRNLMRRRMEYAMGMVRSHATLARLRNSRRLPLTEAAYNGQLEVLQLFRMRRTPLYGASRTWLYPSAPPPFAPLGDGTRANYVLEAPMSVADCAEAGTRDRGCKQRIPGRGWVGETDAGNRCAMSERIAGSIWREITTVAAMGKGEKDRRRALRVKMRKQEELVKSMDAAIEDGYLKAPEIVALCEEGASIDRETENGMTALISAAEEDPHALGHTWVENNEGWEVLAAALLLDRRIHRPKIDFESRVTGHTALTRACVLGRLETAEVLLDRGADINRLPKCRPITPLPPLRRTPRRRPGSPPPLTLTGAPDGSALRMSSSSAAAAAVAVAAAARGGVGAGVRERACRPPIVAAAAAGHAAVVKLLLERGADPELRDRNGETAADVAKKAAFVDVLAQLARKESGYLGVAVGERGAANPLVPCGWGCGKLVATGHHKAEHEQECDHREVECSYNCGAYRLQKRQLERHLAETCRLRPVVCSTRCGVSVVAEEYANHQATTCAMRPVVCKACNNKVVASALARHELETCPMRMVECEQGCGEEVPVSGLARHLSKTCPLMAVTCRLGCSQSMQLKMLAEHEGSLCSERLVPCRWQCLEDVKAKHIDEHEKLECRRADAPCGNRCGLYLPLGDMKRHYAESCAHRFVPCRLGCGYRVRAKDLHTHESIECGARLISCPSGCGSDDGGGTATLFPARALDLHLKYDCAFRLVKCAACDDEVTARELDAHKQNTCRRRTIPCSDEGCCLKLPAEDMITHEERECSRRQVWCLQGCGEEMRADKRRQHHETACPMRYLPCPLGCPKKVRASEADDHADFLCVRRHLA